jgi:hypothetical protein
MQSVRTVNYEKTIAYSKVYGPKYMRVALVSKVMEKLDIKAGNRVLFVEDDGRIYIKKA